MADKDMESTLQQLIDSSGFLADIRRCNGDPLQSGIFAKNALRPLTPEEIDLLQKNNNMSSDWHRIHVAEKFSPAFIWNSRFDRDIIIGSIDGSVCMNGRDFNPGIYNSCLSDTIVGDGTLLQNIGFCSGMIIGKEAVLLNIGSISHDTDASFSVGRLVPAGNEAGKRFFPLLPELDHSDICPLIAEIGNEKKSVKIMTLIKKYADAAVSHRGIVGDYSVITGSTRLSNVYIGAHAQIIGAAEISHSAVLSGQKFPALIGTGAVIRNTVLLGGSRTDTQAVIENSLIARHAVVEKQAKVTDSYIGPLSHIGSGEVTASIVGPLVGMHHQSLLIAACWPEGKGNIAYGANVGSNHTGKKNDQEIWPGEGTFFGLGCTIKFPCNLKKAPYSIIASGVTTLPQKIIFPFSLINTPSAAAPGIPPAFNEIMPAWVLSHNSYTLFRNQRKYRLRIKPDSGPIPAMIFREEIIDLMSSAKELLGTASGKDIYTEIDFPGLGKNFCTETNRMKAIQAYNFFIRLYALEILLEISKAENGRPLARILEQRETDKVLQKCIMVLVGKNAPPVIPVLAEEYINKKQELKSMLLASKQKDDFRGKRIFENYTQTHITVREDVIIKELLTDFDADIQRFKSYVE